MAGSETVKLIKRRAQFFWCWMIYRTVLIIPLRCERLLFALLPTAGEYAHAQEPDCFGDFCANRDRLEGTIYRALHDETQKGEKSDD